MKTKSYARMHSVLKPMGNYDAIITVWGLNNNRWP